MIDLPRMLTKHTARRMAVLALVLDRLTESEATDLVVYTSRLSARLEVNWRRNTDSYDLYADRLVDIENGESEGSVRITVTGKPIGWVAGEPAGVTHTIEVPTVEEAARIAYNVLTQPSDRQRVVGWVAC